MKNDNKKPPHFSVPTRKHTANVSSNGYKKQPITTDISTEINNIIIKSHNST